MRTWLPHWELVALTIGMLLLLAACQPAPTQITVPASGVRQTFSSEIPVTGVMRYEVD